MKHLRLKRLVFFCTRDSWSWLGWSLAWDYHNIIGTVTVLTAQVGLEYVRSKSDLRIKKHSYGWSMIRLG